jgi:hypothetical protein
MPIFRPRDLGMAIDQTECHPMIERRSDWPQIRADLEQKLAMTIRQFIADGSFASDAIRAFAKKVSTVERDLDHLDAVESKAREIGRVING